MRLMTLLQELVRDKGFKGAARVLEVDQRTVAECARTGQLSRRVRQALERALQEGVGSAAARQRERRRQAGEAGRRALAEAVMRRWQRATTSRARNCGGVMAAVEGEVSKPCKSRDGPQGTGAGHAGAGPSQPWFRQIGEPSATRTLEGSLRHEAVRVRREYPDLVTLEPAEDDEEVFGAAWALIVEWRGAEGRASQRGRRASTGWLSPGAPAGGGGWPCSKTTA